MRKYFFLLFLLIVISIIYFNLLNYSKKSHLSISFHPYGEKKGKNDVKETIYKGSILLKTRNDDEALGYFENALMMDSENLQALWGKAEILRRKRQYEQAEELLRKILALEPEHTSSLISLAFIMYKKGNLKEVKSILDLVFKNNNCSNEDKALAYTILSMITNKEIVNSGLLNKIKQIKRIEFYLTQAKELAPQLPEVHVGLGTFYLFAPKVLGGDIHKAIEELKLAVNIAPNFATANARLAQAYKRKGELEKYNFYIKRTKELDPDNEVLSEIKD